MSLVLEAADNCPEDSVAFFKFVFVHVSPCRRDAAVQVGIVTPGRTTNKEGWTGRAKRLLVSNLYNVHWTSYVLIIANKAKVFKY